MKRTTGSLTLIVPGLLDPVPYLDQLPVQDLPELTVFSKMLSRGNFNIPADANNKFDNLYSCVMKEMTTMNNFLGADQATPVASLTYLADFKQSNMIHHDSHENDELSNISLSNKWVMRADPCFMVADRDQIVLARTGDFELSFEEAILLADEINSFFKNYDDENFWTLKVVSPQRWYIISDKPIDISSVPPEMVIGQSVKPFLFSNQKLKEEASHDTRHWLSLFNEFQMILHQSEVNKIRTQEKKTPINSLWFWGAGKGIDHPSFSLNDEFAIQMYSNNPFVQSISQLVEGKCSELPLKYEQCTDSASKKIIYVIDDFYQAINNKDIFTWIGLLDQFNMNYLTPIVDAIEVGSIHQVEVVSPSGRSLLVSKKLLKRWWKKSQMFHSILSTGEHFKK